MALRGGSGDMAISVRDRGVDPAVRKTLRRLLVVPLVAGTASVWAPGTAGHAHTHAHLGAVHAAGHVVALGVAGWEAAYTVSGTVREAGEGGGAIEGATVTIDGTDFVGTTDDAGTYVIEAVPEDTYVITASRSGYKSHTKDVDVNAAHVNETEQSILVNFELEVDDQPPPEDSVTVKSITYSTSGGPRRCAQRSTSGDEGCPPPSSYGTR
jgi:hypothetical protein